MRILFVHQNFPGQYRHLAPLYARTPGVAAAVIGERKNIRADLDRVGVSRALYDTPQGPGEQTHPYLRSTEAAVRRGQQAFRAASALKQQGFVPDVICGHPGWGDCLYLREVYPDARMILLLEFFYRTQGGDMGFDPEFPHAIDLLLRAKTRNATQLLTAPDATAMVSPTAWQRSRYPDRIQADTTVIHDGVDTQALQPDRTGRVKLGRDGPDVGFGDELITFVARGLEPYRGFHVFMRALPQILRRRPKAHVAVIGDDTTHYGSAPPDGRTWRAIMMAEVGDRLPLDRVHFLGPVPYGRLITLLRLSGAHVYLTYPFVLSWSMLEAMALGALVIGSATPPVMEVIRHGENGLLVDFFDTAGLADAVDRVFESPDRLAPLRDRARATVVARYDLNTVCLPAHRRLIEQG